MIKPHDFYAKYEGKVYAFDDLLDLAHELEADGHDADVVIPTLTYEYTGGDLAVVLSSHDLDFEDVEEIINSVLNSHDKNIKVAFNFLLTQNHYSPYKAARAAKDVELWKGYLEDYAERWYRDTGNKIPAMLEAHIDWQGVGEDLLHDGDLVEYEGFLILNNNEL